MDSPYAPPLSPDPSGIARVRSLRALRIFSLIVGLATMFAAVKSMTLMRSLEVLGSEMGVPLSPLASLLISNREEVSVLPIACGLLALFSPFLKSRRKLLVLLSLSIFTAAITAAFIAILFVEFQRSILPLFR